MINLKKDPTPRVLRPGAGVSNTVHGLHKTGMTEFLTHLQREEKSKKMISFKQLKFFNVRYCP